MKPLKYACLSVALLTLAACGRMGTPLPEVAPDNELAPLDVVTASDVVALGNTSRKPGYLGSASFYITNENTRQDGDPVNQCNASTSTPVTVRVTSSDPSKITIDGPGYVTLTDCGSDPETVKSIGYQVLSTATEGPVIITGTASGGRNGGKFTAGEFTVQITIPAPTDNTAPIITPTIDPLGPNGLNGWYTSDVTIQWNAVDGESAISSNPCASTTIDADTSGTTLTCTATSAGGTSSKSVTIKRDATVPTVTPADVNDATWRNSALSEDFTASDATSGLANTADASFTLTALAQSADADTPTVVSKTVTDKAGNSTTRTLSALIDTTAPSVEYTSPAANTTWYTNHVTATFTATDNLSGFGNPARLTSTGTVMTSSEGPDVTVSSPAFTDNASNTVAAGAATSASYKIDLSDPTNVQFVGGISDRGSYYFGSVPAAPTCTAQDAVSGLASCVVTGHSTAIGSHTLTATATDNAGRTATATMSYTVLAWTLKGFYSPVDMNGVVNTVKAGSTVPLKFEIFAASELTSTSAISSFTTAVVNCSTLGATADEIEVTTTGGTGLRYDSTAGQFIQNWQTPKTVGACYRATMTTQDGSFLTAFFKTR